MCGSWRGMVVAIVVPTSRAGRSEREETCISAVLFVLGTDEIESTEDVLMLAGFLQEDMRGWWASQD